MKNNQSRQPSSESKMGQLISAKDWAETSMGAMEEWPQSLHSALNMCLNSNSPVSICWGDEQLFLYNDAWKDLLGDNHPAPLGQPASTVFEGSWEVLYPKLNQVFTTREVAECNNQLISFAGGEKYFLDLLFSPIPDENGSVGGIFCIATEASGQKMKRSFDRSTPNLPGQDEVNKSENTKPEQQEITNALLGAIVEGSDDAIISKNLNSIITSWNSGAERIFGYTAEEAIGQPITLLFPEDRLDEEEEIISRIKRGERVDHFETKRKRKDGTLLDISLTVSPIKDSEGNIVGASKIARDITERKEAEKKLEAMNETLEERVKERTQKLRSHQKKLRSLASKLNKAEERERRRLATELHDKLGQILTIAKMKVDGLQHGNQFDDPSRDIEDLKQVIEDALNFNQNLMAELKPPPSLNKEDVTEVLKWTVKMMKRRGLDIDVEDDGKIKPVDKEFRTILHQSARELLKNVEQHAGTNKARMVISREKGHVKVTVEDEGKGFNMEEKTLPPVSRGRFGLFNIQERMDWHGGKFRIHSEPGKGTKAILIAPLKDEEKLDSLSRYDEEGLPSQRVEKQADLWQKIKVLLVDDHEMVRRGFRQMIEREDDMTIVAEASNGKEAVELASETSPDVIIMDVNMPLMDGIEATEKIKASMPNVHIIGLSLHGSAEVRKDMKSAGASDYLAKNEAFETLCATIRREVG